MQHIYHPEPETALRFKSVLDHCVFESSKQMMNIALTLYKAGLNAVAEKRTPAFINEAKADMVELPEELFADAGKKEEILRLVYDSQASAYVPEDPKAETQVSKGKLRMVFQLNSGLLRSHFDYKELKEMDRLLDHSIEMLDRTVQALVDANVFASVDKQNKRWKEIEVIGLAEAIARKQRPSLTLVPKNPK